MALGLLATQQWVYWAETDGLVRISLAGGTPTKVTTPRLRRWLLLQHAGRIYCTDGELRVLSWRDLEPETATPLSEIRAQGGTFWNEMFYWTTEEGEVKRASLSTWKAETLVTGQSDPTTIVADKDGLYWTNQGEDPASDLREPRRGAGVLGMRHTGRAAEPWASCRGYCWDLLTTSNGVVFSDIAAGEIVRVDKKSKARTVIASGQKEVRGLRADGSMLYWAVDGGAIMRAPERGGATQLIAKGVEVRDLIIVGALLYWLDADGPKETGTGTLRRVRIDGE
ncbi:MAG: hypothetical protein AMXMBFR22_33060 [Phycisphaerae bacterium]